MDPVKKLQEARSIYPHSYTLRVRVYGETQDVAQANGVSLTEAEAASVERRGPYEKVALDKVLATLANYHLKNRKVQIARQEGTEKFNSTHLAIGLNTALTEGGPRIVLPDVNLPLEIILEKTE